MGKLIISLNTHCCILIMLSLIVISSPTTHSRQQRSGPSVRLAIHGGAGTILKANMTPELEMQYRDKLSEALLAGYDVLKKDGSSLDAVETTIKILEDSPLFNAGKGAVFTHDGTNELDAAIMDGKTLKAGAVAGVKHIKNPISLARMVMEHSPHVLLVGEGAEVFARERGMHFVPQEYFYTERRWKQLQQAKEEETRTKDSLEQQKKALSDSTEKKHGTVGCVALDRMGNLASGTSTGGTTNKRFGRVGDSPIIGAGTYANNHTCAVSATGTGEYFIRSVVAHDISAMMEYGGMSVGQASETVVMKKLPEIGGDGGVIAIDKDGNIAISFNTPGMYRAYIDDDGKPVVKIYKE
ncbi:MAG: isoaspartyl peptidase/L-asparaginase [Ignavibacteria bacterium]|nr:isoaspartyl peptidase/L-asparaginase [Ignavibacteria bacterium]